MKKIKLFIEDITLEHIEFCDKYLKKVITNAKKRFYRPQMQIKKYGIVFVGIDTYAHKLLVAEEGYEEVFTTYVTINDIQIPVHNQNLAEILLELSDTQRMVLLRTVVLGDKLTDIAKEIGVSVPMVAKYKKKALKIIKERMSKREC